MALSGAVGYVRVSTVEQVAGHGLEVQEQAIRAWCKKNRLRLVATYRDEGQSGSNGIEDRVGLAGALGALKAGEGEQLVVYRLDRLARDLILQETLIERLREQGTPVVSATEDVETDTDDPTRVLIRQVLGVIAQYEKSVIRGRMMAGKAAKREAGGYVGGTVPYGFRLVDGQVLPDPDEQVVVALVGRMAASGLSLRAIGAELNRRGHRPRSGDAWHPNTVRRIACYSPQPA